MHVHWHKHKHTYINWTQTHTHTPNSDSLPLFIGKQKAITEIYAEGKVSDCLSLAASS